MSEIYDEIVRKKSSVSLWRISAAHIQFIPLKSADILRIILVSNSYVFIVSSSEYVFVKFP